LKRRSSPTRTKRRSTTSAHASLAVFAEAVDEVEQIIADAAASSPKTAFLLKRGLDRVRKKPTVSASPHATVICATTDMPSPDTDNILAACAECGAAIYHRPYVPDHVPEVSSA